MVYITVYGAGREENGELLEYLKKNYGKLPEQVIQIEANWPVDLGDDPSFLSYSLYRDRGGHLTWGICRPNVRKNLASEDTIIFIAYSSVKGYATYKLSAIAVVDSIKSHWEISGDDSSIFRSYANLMLQKNSEDGDYEHKEWFPIINGDNRWHEDWLWKLGKVKRVKGNQNTYKRTFVELGKTGQINLQWLKSNYSYLPSTDYVLFSKEKSFILEQPPIIATFDKTSSYEQWHEDPIAALVRNNTLDLLPPNKKRFLRSSKYVIDKAQYGFLHQHIKMKIPEEENWRIKFTNGLLSLKCNRANWS